MPSSYSAKDNPSLVGTCVVCQKKTPTALMVSMPGSENGAVKQYVVCGKCAEGGWRPPGFTQVYKSRPDF